MAVVVIRNFGGIVPAASPRALPPAAAVTAASLHAASSEFRPVLDSVTYSAVLSVSNPKTIYRMSRLSGGAFNTDPALGWKAYANWTNLVRWPQNDNNTERTSVSDGAGGYAPRVIDNTGQDRLLGVPAPVKPVLTLNAGTYFTEQNRLDAIAKLKADVLSTLKANLARAKVGAVYTADATPGYLEDGAEQSAEPTQIRYRVHRYSAFEGSIVDAYTAAAEADVAWLRATRYGEWKQSTGTPSWMGASGTWHYALAYGAYGAGFKFSKAAAITALDALTYVDNAQATEIADLVDALFSPTGAQASSVIKPLRAVVAELEAKMDSRPQGTVTPAATTTEITALKNAAALQIYTNIARFSGQENDASGGI